MAQQNPVEVVEVCKVASVDPDHHPHPRPAAPSSPNSFTLSLFNLSWLRFPPSSRLLFHQIPTPNTTTTTSTSGDAVSLFFDSILPILKSSLSLTLHHFSPLVGNLTWLPN
ncbi:Chloramphenicol acetyltransferase-like domain containing protein [Trema orientale]|uniref:Chloramphenicol acetyltransferase-like domain containing protein n=1 Tax=Trema orientale TaxID=63057 RepID=A0A2P5FVP2_TREOI|nr:Chloramphenicol acetyltransferase-like domain containing protein [Trema orientale]